MNIVVCIKQVPDTNEIKIDPVTNNLIRDGVESILNPYDANGIESALQIREATGGKVILVSMGPMQAKSVLEAGLRMGADEAYLISDRAVGGSDTLATGYIISKMIELLEYDLIICGSEAIDGATGQVGPIIAGNLGIPQFTYVRNLSFESGKLNITREVGSFIESYSSELPCMVCVQKDINQPRTENESDKTVKIVTAKDLGLDPKKIGNAGSPTRVVRIDVGGKAQGTYVDVDSSLSWEERIEYIIRGGMEPKEKIDFWRGASEALAERMVNDDLLSGYIRF